MKFKIFSTLLFTLVTIIVCAHPLNTSFDKDEYYTSFLSSKIATIDIELKILNESVIDEKEGYEGALLLKKAGLSKKISDKISYTKLGRTKLEACIKKFPENIELRFLRFTIQENVPAIICYKSELKEDKLFILKHYKTSSPSVQKYIIDYSKKSKILTPKDF